METDSSALALKGIQREKEGESLYLLKNTFYIREKSEEQKTPGDVHHQSAKQI